MEDASSLRYGCLVQYYCLWCISIHRGYTCNFTEEKWFSLGLFTWREGAQASRLTGAYASLGNLSTRRFLRGDGNRKSNLLPIHVSRRQGPPSRIRADFVLLILTSPVKREFFVLLYHFACNILHTVIRKILFYRSGVFTSDCQVFKVFFSTF